MTMLLAAAAQRLNSSCFCITLDREGLHAAMERKAQDPTFSVRYIRSREHLFSNVPVFHSRRDLETMSGVVRMIEPRTPRRQAQPHAALRSRLPRELWIAATDR